MLTLSEWSNAGALHITICSVLTNCTNTNKNLSDREKEVSSGARFSILIMLFFCRICKNMAFSDENLKSNYIKVFFERLSISMLENVLGLKKGISGTYKI
jgi:hypothetical protein